MPTNDPNDALEDLFDRTLRGMPPRQAPPALESRVFRELERRAALPWWRRSFTHWPLAARMTLLLICCALAGMAVVGSTTVAAGIRSLYWAREIGVLEASGASLIALLASTAPPIWFYQGIAVCAVLYAALFGLGAVLYRTLYLQPLNGNR
jgi:hypothetical protein